MKSEGEIDKLSEYLSRVRGKIGSFKAQLAQLEIEERKLLNALEVLQGLQGKSFEEYEADLKNGPGHVINGPTPQKSGRGNVRSGVRDLIRRQLSSGKAKTKQEILEGLLRVDPTINPASVASQLSRMTFDKEFEKVGKNAYRVLAQ